ncbi:MAG: hypothetical protein K0R54_2088 [Clostridiaceae bacterium]|jgi:hypothetical protein|nr:hypothetical protein [Clostridiaceae bacterium]
MNILDLNQKQEIWRDIEGYEGLYKISDLGRVYSFTKNLIRKPFIMNNGYKAITLSKNDKVKRFLVHRLVAKAFIPNPNNYPCINHKDECKANNFVDNLEWCTHKYNMNYNNLHERITNNIDYKNRKPIDYSKEIFKINAEKTRKRLSKKVHQYDLNMNLIKTWNSTKECGRNGFNQSCVWHCCHGLYEQYKGYIWKYANEVS